MAKKHSRSTDAVSVLGEKRKTTHNVSGPSPTLIADINSSRLNVLFYNSGNVTVYIGKHTLDAPADVLSILNGVPVVAAGTFEDSSSYDQWWAITEDGALGEVVVIESLSEV